MLPLRIFKTLACYLYNMLWHFCLTGLINFNENFDKKYSKTSNFLPQTSSAGPTHDNDLKEIEINMSGLFKIDRLCISKALGY